MRRSLVALVILIIWQSSAFAWSAQGHRIIAQLAWDRASPNAKVQIQKLLGGAGFDFVGDADWADRIKRHARETAKWHYVDIPFDAKSYDQSRDCAGRNCVVEAIKDQEAVIKSAKADQTEKAQALIFLVHLIGDIHQPLHCANRGDKGGNADKVIYNGRRTNLHSFWDQNLVAMQARGSVAIIQTLGQSFPRTSLTSRDVGGPETWANESHFLAKSTAYGPEMGPDAVAVLSEGYIASNRPVVAVQLQKASVRLAWVLNRLWR